MKCIHCGNEVVLRPSAKERAEKCGGKPSDYTRLFRAHADCTIEARDRDVRELMERLRK